MGVLSDLVRSLPISTGVTFMFAMIGMVLANMSRLKFDNALQYFGLGKADLEVASACLTLALFFCFFVDITALMIGLLAAGKTRDVLFGDSQPDFLRSLAKCLGGALTLWLVQIGLWISLISLLCLSYSYLLVSWATSTMSKMCTAQNPDFLISVQDLVNEGPTKGFSLQKFCGGATHLGFAGKLLFIGCAITVLSQGGMLRCLAVDKVRIMAHLDRQKAIVCCKQFRDCLLAFPWGSLIAFLGALIGFTLAGSTRGQVNVALDNMGDGAKGLRSTSTWLKVSFCVTFFVNLVALCIGFLGAPKTRELIFGHTSARDQQTGLLGCFQALGGRAASHAVLLLLQVTTAFQLMMSYAFMFVMMMLLFLTQVVCKNDTSMSAAKRFIGNITSADRTSDPGSLEMVLVDLDVDKYCGVCSGFGSSGSLLFAGCVFILLSQVAMMVSTAAEKERVALDLGEDYSHEHAYRVSTRGSHWKPASRDPYSVEMSRGFRS